MKGLYIHIPFCNTICSYCDFPKMVAKDTVKKEYINHLIEELKTYAEELKDLRSVYIGGGTPNCLSKEDLETLLKALEPYLKTSTENTIEINSELFTQQQAKLFKEYGINRVSIGVQTFQPNLCKGIRRSHTKKMVQDTIRCLKEIGISNINLDMMYGLPMQTMEDLKKDLAEVLALDITHISYYSLILEEKTILNYELKHHQVRIPEDDLVADMANYIAQVLEMSQFNQYEISNFSKKGFESIHNLGYWDCEEYIGIGAAACGYVDHRRYKNHSILKDYYQHPIEEQEWIDELESKKEYMMLGLRKIEGICVSHYYDRFKSYPKDDFDLDKLVKKGLIEIEKDIIRIKKDKILVANLVFEEFVG